MRLGIGNIFVLFLILCSTACAQQKKTVTNGKNYATLQRAVVNRTLPGRREGKIESQYRFNMVWQSSQTPTTFFYKAPNVWMNCSVNKHSIVEGSQKATEIALENIRKGDTIELIPIKGGKFPIPSDIPESLNNVILFKINKSNWHYVSISNYEKADVSMP
jgi:hypothetical protein